MAELSVRKLPQTGRYLWAVGFDDRACRGGWRIVARLARQHEAKRLLATLQTLAVDWALPPQEWPGDLWQQVTDLVRATPREQELQADIAAVEARHA